MALGLGEACAIIYITRRTVEEFETAVASAAQEAAGDGRIILGVADRVPVDADLGRLEAIPGLIEHGFRV